jgi:hypothetical protein
MPMNGSPLQFTAQALDLGQEQSHYPAQNQIRRSHAAFLC